MNNKIQIVIPMSGFGERFRKAGYQIPKPLIEIEGKPIIAHVIEMFDDEKEFIFICNQEHLDNDKYIMKETILKYCPTGKIIGIPAHHLGPIHAVEQIYDLLDLKRPVVVNYCDFTCYWDWKHFKRYILSIGCDGAIPAYKGFHPHCLGTTNYAYIKENNGLVEDIQEKQPFTQNRMDEYASSGTYYFSSAELMMQAFDETIINDLKVNGEFYVSMAFKYLLKEKKNVCVYPLQHFMQWGTPEDVQEYQNWSSIFKKLILNKKEEFLSSGTTIIPLAGAGQRFVDEGYEKIKPLISVSGKPMVLQAHGDLPHTKNNIFVLRKNMKDVDKISNEILENIPNVNIVELNDITDGQACTASYGLEALKDKSDALITFGACDNGMIYDDLKLRGLLEDSDVDVIVWGVRGHPNAIRNPQMFGWIEEENGLIKKISVKKPLINPTNDPIVLGTFTFKKKEYFERSFSALVEKNHRINNEFYIDSCINEAIYLGLKCYYFEVEHYISWGTPNELRTFEYWQSCFHKWISHPYCLEKDIKVNPQKLVKLSEKYQKTIPESTLENHLYA